MLLYLFCAEMAPTSVRAGCLGTLSAAARVGCVFAAPMSNALDRKHDGLALAFFGVLCVSAGKSRFYRIIIIICSGGDNVDPA